MKLFNKSTNGLSHTVIETVKDKKVEKTYFLPVGEHVEVPEKVAKIWLKIKGVEEYVEPADLAKLEAEAKAEKERLEKENQKLKAELEKLKENKE